jgi:uncharacterized protein YutE (UPF0331/DUF86 family)
VVDDIVLAKCDIIERCLLRVEHAAADRGAELDTDYDLQDVVLLNLQRAAQAAIDLAMHMVRTHALGVPQHSGEAFTLLERAGRLDPELARRMKAMVGFRNVAVHQYQEIDMDVVRAIIERGLGDLRELARVALAGEL